MAGRLLGAFEEYLVSSDDAPPESPDSILRGLVCLQPSRTLTLAAAAWHPSPQEATALDALVACVRAWGRPVDGSALTALAAWCEVEALQSTLSPFEPSLYTVEVLLTALRLPFLTVRLDAPHQAAAMLMLSPAGLLARTDCGLTYYDDPSMAAPPAGAEVLVRVPALTRLTASDVQLFLALGADVMACYQADLDKRRRWLRLSAGGDVPERFVDGIRTWHFRGQVLGELRVGQPDERPWVAVWKDNRGCLHYLPPTLAPTDPMTRTPHVPWLPCLDGVPDGFDEIRSADSSQPLVEAARLDRLHAAVQILTEGPPHAFVRLDDDDAADLRQRLQSSEAIGRALARAVEASTMERLTACIGGDHAVDVAAPLHAALDLGGMRDFAAMALMYELCSSPETSSRSFAKSFKPDLMRAALRHHLLELIQDGDEATRGAACRLLATSPCMVAASERAVVEYELKLHLDDDAGVAEQATLALAQSTLCDLVPLPGLFRISQAAAPQGPAGGAERRGRIQGLAREIAAVQKRLGGLPRHSKEASSNAEALAGLVLDVREAMAAAPAPQGRVVLFSPPLLDDLVERVRRHLEAYAWELDISLDDLYARVADEGIARWITFVARAELEAGRNTLDEDEERDVESFAWSRVCEPQPFWIETPGHINPLFSALLRRCAEVGPSSVGIGVLPLGSRTVTRLPAMLYMQVYEPTRHAFVSLVEHALARTTGVEHGIWCLVAAAMPQGDDGGEDEAATEEEPKPVDARPPRPPAPLDIDEAPRPQVERAERLRKAFELPQERLLQVVYVLHDCGVDAPAPAPPAEPAAGQDEGTPPHPTPQPALGAPAASPPLRRAARPA